MGAPSEFRGTDRYEVLERLGSGGMGTVYAAFDRVSRSKIALKLLHQHNPGSLELFKQEFRSIQGIQHRNLISLGELREDRGEWFFTMELVSGDDFRSFVRAGSHARVEQSSMRSPSFLARGASMPSQLFGGTMKRVGTHDMPRTNRRRFHEGRLRDAVGQLACGLAVLHRANKVHSDVKPSNIIVEADGRVVLLDFGIAVDLDEDHQVRSERVIGSVHYMAPEQVEPRATGPASDCYAVGVLLYEALTGTRPFSGTSAREILESKRTKRPKPPSRLAAGVPEDLERLCLDLLECDPSKRPTAEEILRRLGAWQLLAQLPPDTKEPAGTKDLFVGRSAELEHLLSLSKPPITSRVVIVTGMSGVGKTSLMRHFTSMLSNTLVLTGRCHERESVPFKGIDGAIDKLLGYLKERDPQELEALIPDGVSHIARVFPAFGALFDASLDSASTAATPLELRRYAFARLRTLLTRIARRTPIVIAIDDVQFADAETWSLIDHLMRKPHPPPMLVVLFMRPGESLEGAETRRIANLEYLHLEPLSPDASLTLAERLLHSIGRDDADLAREIAGESEGHPLFIREIVRYASEHEDLDLHSDLLDEALRARFERLSADALLVLQLLSTAGIPMKHTTMAVAADIDLDRYLRLVSELRSFHLVQTTGADPDDTLTHDHDRVRVTLLAQLDITSEQRLHLQLANALQLTGEASNVPEITAHHLMVGGRPREASAFWLDAAEQSMESLAFESAAARYQAALKTGTYEGKERQRILLRLAEASVNSGRGLEAAQSFLEVADATDDRTTRIRCRYQAAEQLLISGHIDQGRSVLDEVLGIIDVRLPKSRVGVVWSLLWRRAWLRVRGYRWRERPAGELPEYELLKVDIKRTTGRALGMVEPVVAASLQCRALLRALRVGEPVRLGWCLAFEAAFLSSAGTKGIERGRTLLGKAGTLAMGTDDKPLQAWIHTCAGILDCMAGHYREADACLLEAARRFDQFAGYAWEQNTLRVFRLLNLRSIGEFQEMRALRDQYLPDAIDRGDLHAETTIRRLSAIMWLASDDPEAARRDLDAANWNTTSDDLQLQDWYDIRARSEIALYERKSPKELEHALRELSQIEKSNLIRVQVTRIEQRFLRGRVLLALMPESGREIVRIARLLESERCISADVAAAFLRAGCATLQDDTEGAIHWLGCAEQQARTAGAEWLSRVATLCRARLENDDQGKRAIESSLSWMLAHGVKAPETLTAFVLPTANLALSR